MPSLNESDTRAKLINPAIYRRGWSEEMIRREETAGTIDIIGGKARRRSRGRVDYVLRVRVNVDTQPIAIALIEAKKESLPPGHGLEQGKNYAKCKRLNVPFVFSSNGHQFVEYDSFTGMTSAPRPMSEFPTPAELQARYEQKMGFRLDHPAARPLLQPYSGGEGSRRYYQDAAIRAVIEKIARCEVAQQPKRALLSMATGVGKTYIAVNLLKRIADAGQMTRALFVCDRDELRTQALKAFNDVFGSDAAEVKRISGGGNNAKNARVHVATYQTLGIATENDDSTLLTEFYPENYFSHIIIDECHRSAWGKWSQVLTRNREAAHIGLTATPRQLKITGNSPEIQADLEITANNLRYFGEPVYEYELAQAIEDGYLAGCEIQKSTVNLDQTGISREDILARYPRDAVTGRPITPEQLNELYERHQFEDRIMLPDRVLAMCQDLFDYLLATGGPEQKTIIFCTRDHHADAVAAQINNLYAAWCLRQGQERLENYAFKCTSASSGNDQLPDFRGSTRSYFVATTVDLLTTGVDVPCVRNIAFFKYLKSPISFYQMVGRGTRLDIPNEKMMFRVYDYTDATRLFGEAFISVEVKEQPPQLPPDPGNDDDEPRPDPPQEPIITVDGFNVHISDLGRFIVADVDGRAMPITVEDYCQRLTACLVQEVASLQQFRQRWINIPQRLELLDFLVSAGYSPKVVRLVRERDDYDLYDVLAELGWGMEALTRQNRADAFAYKQEDWLKTFPDATSGTIQAIARQFAKGGTEALEIKELFSTAEIKAAGGIKALKLAGNPTELFLETKARIFAA